MIVSSSIGIAFAQEPVICAGATVIGQVVNSAGSGIPGTTVTDGSASTGANTTGWFRITGLSAGGQAVDISAPGYHSQSITVNPGQCSTVSVGQIVLAQSPQGSSPLVLSGDSAVIALLLVGLLGLGVGAVIMSLRNRKPVPH